ncbi:MAG: hypothetical protein J6C44_07980 [Muribaculaceae bacterium]|nr:hypothetical protein [Muribaculaceae bacterium]
MKFKNIIALLIIALSTLGAHAEIKYVNGSLRLTNSSDIKQTKNDLGQTNMASSLVDFPMDHDGNKKTTLLRVKFKTLAFSDIRDKFRATPNNGKHVVKTEYHEWDGQIEYWIFFDSGKCEIDFDQIDGLGKVRVPEYDYESEQMYTLTLEGVDLTTISFTDPIGGTEVILDGKSVGVTKAGEPLSVNNINLGSHAVKYMKDGRSKTENIEVSKHTTTFNADTRTPIDVTFETDEAGAGITIDNEPEAYFPTTRVYTLKLFEGKHTVTVRSLKQGGEGGVERPITVTPTQNYFNIKASQTRTIQFSGIYANTPTSGINVTITNPQEGFKNTEIGQTPVTRVLPYGKYKVEMVYAGSRSTKTLKVNQATPSDFTMALTPRRERWNPLDVDYKKRIWGMSAAWVSKQYVGSMDSRKETLELLWEDPVKTLNGVQIGVPIMPELGKGFIVNTGLFAEFYFSSSDGMDFTEYNLYIPAQIGYKLPFTSNFAIYATGGIGMDIGLGLELEYGDEKYDIDRKEYGLWNAFQLNGEVQVGLRFKALQCSFNYGWGLTNNPNMVIEEAKCHQRKMTVNLGVMF